MVFYCINESQEYREDYTGLLTRNIVIPLLDNIKLVWKKRVGTDLNHDTILDFK